MTFWPPHRFQCVRKVAASRSVMIAVSPGCSVPNVDRLSEPGMRELSSKLQLVMSWTASPTLASSTNSPSLVLSYMYSVTRTSGPLHVGAPLVMSELRPGLPTSP